jgi:tetratricopeptide (TPR) repeat protein/DNA-binding XRE family transcriptional regulator
MAYRRRLALTQEELADRSGLSVRTIRDIESGRARVPRPASVRRLADTFGLRGEERDAFHRHAAGAEEPTPRDALPGRGVGVVPAQLPADVPSFTGRRAELARLDALLARAGVAGPTSQVPGSGAPGAREVGAVVISALSGTAGVGKTALAVHWAHRVADLFPDGQLYANLRGFDPSGRVMAPSEAVRGFLVALGVQPDRMPYTVDAQVALYRSLLAGKRILVVLDNARDADHARPLLPGTATALAVVTSRNQLTPLLATEGAHPLTLDLLSVAEARDLLTRRLGRDRVAAEPEAVEAIVTACARLPLALTIVAARAQQTGFPLATIAAELDTAGHRLDALDAGDATSQVRAVFSWSYTALSPPAARLFRLLGLHPGPDVSAAAAAGLAGVPPEPARRLLVELARASLVTEHVPGRYAFHDLLRAYAGDVACADEPDEARRAALTRMFDHYAHTAHAADRLLKAHRDAMPLPLPPPAAGCDPERLVDSRAATAWLSTEQPVLRAALRQAAADGFAAHAWQITWGLDTILDRRGLSHERVGAWQVALAAAQRLDDPAAQAYAHRRIARAGNRLGRHAEAAHHLGRSLELYVVTGDRAGQGDSHYDLAGLRYREGRPEDALHHAQEALELYRATGDRRGQAFALNTLGLCHAGLGDHRAAVVSCEEALELIESLGDADAAAATWDSLGYAHHNLGEHDRAAECYGRALELIRELGGLYEEADVLTHLGDTRQAAGDPVAAGAAWRDALEILSHIESPDADAVRARLRDLDRRASAPGPADSAAPSDPGTVPARHTAPARRPRRSPPTAPSGRMRNRPTR